MPPAPAASHAPRRGRAMISTVAATHLSPPTEGLGTHLCLAPESASSSWHALQRQCGHGDAPVPATARQRRTPPMDARGPRHGPDPPATSPSPRGHCAPIGPTPQPERQQRAQGAPPRGQQATRGWKPQRRGATDMARRRSGASRGAPRQPSRLPRGHRAPDTADAAAYTAAAHPESTLRPKRHRRMRRRSITAARLR